MVGRAVRRTGRPVPAPEDARSTPAGRSATAEPVTGWPTRPLSATTMSHRWRDVTFVHWPVDPEVVVPLLPAGTVPDLIGGRTYVGLVPFRMADVGLLSGPALPWLGDFLETNVRLYSVDGDGRRGVVFRSLDAERLLTVLAARVGYRYPYAWSAMELARDDRVLRYGMRRRWPRRPDRHATAPPGPAPASRVAVRVGPRLVAPTDLERWVTARWGTHSAYGRRTIYTPVRHGPWPLHAADLLECDDDLVSAAGLPRPEGPPASVLWSPGVRVWFGPPSLAG